MSGADASPLMLGRAPVGTPLPRREDRWLGSAGSKAARITTATMLILLGSVAFHGGLVATAFISDPSDLVEPEQEIAVDLVPEEPKPTEEAKAAEAAPPPAKVADAKPPEAKPPEVKPPEPKPPEPKPQEARPPEVKAEAKPPEAKPPEVKPPEPPVKVAEAPAAKPPPPPPAPSAAAKEQAELKALEDELAALKAERAAEEKTTAMMAPKRGGALPAGFGPLPGSFQAVALPSESVDGEAVSYSALVFSQLAKAKGIGRREGKPGTAGVRFDVADDGALGEVALVTSSGIKSLDDEAVAIVRKAAPFPAPPAGAQRNFTANVSFITDAAR